MPETEDLRAALIELDRLRDRERAASHESETLFRLLDGMSAAADGDSAAEVLIARTRAALGADAVVLLGAAEGAALAVRRTGDPGLAGLVWPAGAELLRRSRRMTDLHARDWGAPVPEALSGYRALMVAGVAVAGEPPLALACLSRRPGAFGAADLHLLGRIARIAGPALERLRLARRNALLAGMIDGTVPPDRAPGLFDAPLEAASRAVDRLTRAQAAAVEITNDLLRAPSDGVDAAIDLALARTGALAGSDRTYVFRLRPPDRLDNSHEWTAPGIAPMMAELQDMPADLMAPWQPAFDADREVYIPDVADLPPGDPIREVLEMQEIRSLLAVPMRQDGRLTGFVGYDAVRAPRSFLPGEIFLLRSVANVINAVLERRAAEDAVAHADAALRAERNRMQATLEAMPDLVLELDGEGRFTGHHAGPSMVLDRIARDLIGRLPEQVFPPEGAAIARRVMAEVDRDGQTAGHPFRYDLPDGRRWFQISAAARQGAAGTRGYVFVVRDITEARAQLREIERLGEVARRSTNLIVVTDPDGRIDWVNAAFETRTGWRLDEVKGRRPADFLQGPRTDAATRARIRAALDARVPVSAELLNRDRHGQDYWISLDIQPLTDGRGRHRGFMAVQSDITERRRQEAELAATTAEALAARSRLVAAVEALQDGFAIYDAEDRLVLCNAPYRGCFPRSAHLVVPGARYEDLLRRRLADGEYAEATGREEAWLAERLAGHRAAVHETEQRLADGRWLRVLEKAMPDGGRVALRVDITALKAAERRALEERAAAMEASRDGIAITDAAGRFVYMNPAHRAMFGIGPDEPVQGMGWSDLYAAETADWMRRTAFPELQRRGDWQGDVAGRHRDGRAVAQEISLTLKADGGIVCITRDIAERRRSEAERARLREELQLAQRREILGQLAGGLAHDFNNILAVVAGSAGVIEARQGPAGPDTADAARIREAAERATGLVARLRDLGRHGGNRADIDLRKPVTEAAELLRSGLPAAHRLVLSLPEAPLFAHADPVDVLQVALNLAINARDALGNEPGEIALSLASADPSDPDATARPPDLGRLRPGRPCVALRVADTGHGMAPETRARIFEPWFSTKGTRGTGLGLAVVAGIVRANGAALWLDSAPGKGTQVTIFWPVEPEVAPDAVPAPDVGSDRLDGLRLMVVDDVEAVCAVLATILEQAGAEVATATDPADARDAIAEDPDHWAALITDHDMPGLSGSDLARAARGLAPDLPVLLVSALPDAATDAELFDAVLAKPVAPAALVAAVARAVASRKPRE